MQEILQQVLVILRGMWKFRWPGLVVAWATAIVGVVVVMKIPDQYEATARIYVDTDSILKPLMAGLTVQPNVEQQIGMLSRTLISRPNLEKLIRMADLDLKSAGKGDQEALIERLTSGIQIRTAGGLNLYSLAYRDSEQDRAKRVIQSLVSIFVESGLGSSRKDTDAAKTFLNEQIKTFEAKLEEAEARMKQFRLRNIDTQFADGKDAAARLAEANQQLEVAKLQLREAENARDAARQQLEIERRGQSAQALPDLLAGTDVAPATPELDARLGEQRRGLDALLQRYTDKHPDVVTTKRRIAELEAQRDTERSEIRAAQARHTQAGAGGRSGGTQSLAAQELARSSAAAEVQVAALRARVSEFAARAAGAREALKTAPQIEAEEAQLNRDYAITKKNYEDLVTRRQSAVMSGELDVASGVAEFRLIDPPRVAPKPVSPNRMLLLPGVLLAAIGAGVFFAFAAAQMRPTFASGEDLRKQTGLPLLGVVTMLRSEVDKQQERASLFRFVAASGGLVGLFMAGLITLSLVSRFGG
ncbi:MAG: chain length-determining protein [Rubrivivax sp.]|jgi:polysaccharide chain length determinant protein (PEP-CTERM system associated)|nr:chain length-determining protein [Rubrivivax sp.]